MQTKNRPQIKDNFGNLREMNNIEYIAHLELMEKIADEAITEQDIKISQLDTLWHNALDKLNELKAKQPLSHMDWVALNYGDEFPGEENLMIAYEDEDILEAYKEYLYEQFN